MSPARLRGGIRPACIADLIATHDVVLLHVLLLNRLGWVEGTGSAYEPAPLVRIEYSRHSEVAEKSECDFDGFLLAKKPVVEG